MWKQYSCFQNQIVCKDLNFKIPWQQQYESLTAAVRQLLLTKNNADGFMPIYDPDTEYLSLWSVILKYESHEPKHLELSARSNLNFNPSFLSASSLSSLSKLKRRVVKASTSPRNCLWQLVALLFRNLAQVQTVPTRNAIRARTFAGVQFGVAFGLTAGLSTCSNLITGSESLSSTMSAFSQDPSSDEPPEALSSLPGTRDILWKTNNDKLLKQYLHHVAPVHWRNQMSSKCELR